MTPGFQAEIERKYLLRALPEAVRTDPAAESAEIEQGYLEGGLRLRRVRSAGGCRFVLTEKRGVGLVRQEREEDLDRARFELLWPQTLGRRLRKRRWRVPCGDLVFEVDEFLDRELVLAEVELPAEDYAVALPRWLEAELEREVTLDPRFSNARLAR